MSLRSRLTFLVLSATLLVALQENRDGSGPARLGPHFKLPGTPLQRPIRVKADKSRAT
jgi:hypothetical protein